MRQPARGTDIAYPEPRTIAPRRLSFTWLGWGIVALFTAGFIYLNRREWPQIIDAAREARPAFLALALLFQVCWFVAFGSSYWAGFRAVGAPLPYTRTLPLAWAANFINMMVKSGGMGGMALFIAAGTRRGLAGSRVTLGYLMVILLGNVEFLGTLALAVALLSLEGNARRFELIAAAAVFGASLAVAIGAAMAVQSRRRVRQAYRGIAATLNRLAALVRRGPVMDPDGAHHAANEIQDVVTLIRERPSRILPTLTSDVIREASAVATFYAVLRAFDSAAPLSLAVIAYALMIVFSYVSIVPSGLGLVEVSVTALLIRSGVPTGAAALTTVAYRLFQFWTPFLVGAVAIRFTGGSEIGKAKTQTVPLAAPATTADTQRV